MSNTTSSNNLIISGTCAISGVTTLSSPLTSSSSAVIGAGLSTTTLQLSNNLSQSSGSITSGSGGVNCNGNLNVLGTTTLESDTTFDGQITATDLLIANGNIQLNSNIIANTKTITPTELSMLDGIDINVKQNLNTLLQGNFPNGLNVSNTFDSYCTGAFPITSTGSKPGCTINSANGGAGGSTYILNKQGTGAGGFWFLNSSNSAPPSTLFSVDQLGNLTTIGSINGTSGNFSDDITLASAKQLKFTNSLNRKMTLYDANTANAYEFYGLSMENNVMRYNLGSTSATHIFSGTNSNGNGTNFTNLMHIHNNGVGIGGIVPTSYKLDVNGNARMSGLITANAGITSTTGVFSGLINANAGISGTTGVFSGLINANASLTTTGLTVINSSYTGGLLTVNNSFPTSSTGGGSGLFLGFSKSGGGFGEVDYLSMGQLGSGGHFFYTSNNVNSPSLLAKIESNGNIVSSGSMTAGTGLTVTSGSTSLKNTTITGTLSTSDVITGTDLNLTGRILSTSTTQNTIPYITSSTITNGGLLQSARAKIGSTIPNFDSGWIAITKALPYTILHNLNITLDWPPTLKVLFSDNPAPSLGSNLICDITNQSVTYNSETGFLIKYLGPNNIQIITANNFVAKCYNGTNIQAYTSGYYRLYMS